MLLCSVLMFRSKHNLNIVVNFLFVVLCSVLVIVFQSQQHCMMGQRLPSVMATKLSEHLEPPEQFPFPFQPYDIQRDFMRELYFTLDRGHVGIFESPTGTVRPS